MGLKSLFFASSLMLVLVTCSAQTSTNATDAGTTATDLATEAVVTSMVPETDPATTAPKTKAPATDAPETDAPATKPPTTNAPATDAPATKRPTEKPVVGTTDKAPDSGSNKGFSAGSFFGGIILAVAVLGIGFCGFKFYQSRQDKNYQTL